MCLSALQLCSWVCKCRTKELLLPEAQLVPTGAMDRQSVRCGSIGVGSSSSALRVHTWNGNGASTATTSFTASGTSGFVTFSAISEGGAQALFCQQSTWHSHNCVQGCCNHPNARASLHMGTPTHRLQCTSSLIRYAHELSTHLCLGPTAPDARLCDADGRSR